MLVHPQDENIIILGTDGYGILRTDDGGRIWYPWDENITRGALISDMDYQMSNDSVYAVISTYGCGIYKRYMGATVSSSSDVEPKNHNVNAFISQQGLLMINGIKSDFSIHVFNVNGNIVGSCLESQIHADGTILHDVSSWPMGVYLLSCTSEKYQKIIKLIRF